VSTSKHAVSRRSAGSTKERRRKVLLSLAGLVVAVYFLAPFSWLLITSVMREQEALSVPPHWIPEKITAVNYLSFFLPSGTRSIVGSRAAENTLPSIRNSFVAATGTAALNVFLGTLAAYAFARLRFPGRNVLMFLHFGSRMVPGIALVVPLYLVIQRVGLLDNLMALVITYLTFTLPFTIWLLKSYFQGIPRDLEEAAFIDGCSWPRMLLQVLLPTAAPGLVAAAMFAFMTAWNDYLFAVILTSSIVAKTAPVVVAGFATDVTTERTLMAAGGVLAVVPPLLLAFLFQRFIVQGLAAGAVKG
jgi:multiple sugar transport system permease protein